ncbi:MAG: BrnT family toxin [Ruminococcus sp.]|nr:BrnT family toxin [Ruminococcus sp.]MCM1156395.1 BrnT family toxin [Roseburia sp.]
MDSIKFEWDNTKAQLNIEKHGISFSEASTVFADENAILFDDPEHSINEERFMLLGMSSQAKILIVCHCYRGTDEVIRIISARKATKTESIQYNEINKGW